MSLLLGINAYNHQAAAAFVADGRWAYAAEEERFDRIKYSDAFPTLAIEDGLRTLGATAADVSAVGFCWNWRQGLVPRLAFLARHCLDPRACYYVSGLDRIARIRSIQRLPRALQTIGLSSKLFHPMAHHRCHAASAFYSSPFDEAAILSIDGIGEWDTAWLGVGRGLTLQRFARVRFPHSLGLAYDGITQYLGFRKREEAGKVMGLAAYGDPARYRAAMSEFVRPAPGGGFLVNPDWVTWHRYFGYGPAPLLRASVASQLGPPRNREDPLDQRHADVAASWQERFESIMLHVCQWLRRTTEQRVLTMAGGCALNCLANQKIAEESGFDDVFASPAAADAGAAAGAAALLSAEQNGSRPHWTTALLGPGLDAKAGIEALRGDPNLDLRRPDDLCSEVVDLLVDGAIVGWAQDRMEFGPRALGNRSILADPRPVLMKDRVNRQVKHREPFRPFAPACPEEVAADWFEGHLPSPWMMFAATVRPERRSQLGAVTHEDGTARVQTVGKEQQPLFHRLLTQFGERTGVPILLNTSFNVAGEPVVASAADAIRCFLRTELDALVLGSWLAVKKRPVPRNHSSGI